MSFLDGLSGLKGKLKASASPFEPQSSAEPSRAEESAADVDGLAQRLAEVHVAAAYGDSPGDWEEVQQNARFPDEYTGLDLLQHPADGTVLTVSNWTESPLVRYDQATRKAFATKFVKEEVLSLTGIKWVDWQGAFFEFGDEEDAAVIEADHTLQSAVVRNMIASLARNVFRPGSQDIEERYINVWFRLQKDQGRAADPSQPVYRMRAYNLTPDLLYAREPPWAVQSEHQRMRRLQDGDASDAEDDASEKADIHPRQAACLIYEGFGVGAFRTIERLSEEPSTDPYDEEESSGLELCIDAFKEAGCEYDRESPIRFSRDTGEEANPDRRITSLVDEYVHGVKRKYQGLFPRKVAVTVLPGQKELPAQRFAGRFKRLPSKCYV